MIMEKDKKYKENKEKFKELDGYYVKVLGWQVGLSATFAFGGTVGVVAAALDVLDHGNHATLSGCKIKVGIASLALGSLVTYVTSLMKESTNNQIQNLKNIS
ncbi:hypothetical protein DPMN_069744 [Dreissena polymorpha]|uniref:Uncharacterized protein n=1 Tax=Dreissena polymorpha TaxID=45954 RepID=A0A9D4BUL6_DREPO|nr:hypothetical protein DPMN_069744 [Dreissena polymorpha]